MRKIAIFAQTGSELVSDAQLADAAPIPSGPTRRTRKVIAGAASLGMLALLATTAAPADATTAARMTLNPATKTVAGGTTFSLTVKVNTGGQPVNAVQFWVNLPGNIACATIKTIAGGPWPVQAAINCVGTTAAFAVGSNPGTSFTGIGKVATIRIKASTTAGSSSATFDPSKSLVIATPSGQDILGSTNQALITVTSPTG